nr:filamentous hemagglutinin N-terminal domain-containing protein [Leptolyngbyaceae cyanobacterium MAG.088]
MFMLPMPVLVAQLTPDQSLGVEQSIVIQDTELGGELADLIDGGAIRGPNLFHSFSEFNIDEGQRIYFGNPNTVDHIFSRVTGTNPSNIFGTLGVDGPANLFFMNPNGILFGETASLDIEGSFVGTTASSFQFSDGSEFNASPDTDSGLLTVNVPLGLQYGPTPSGSTITNLGTLQTGQDFELRGDLLNLQGQLFSGGNLTLLGTDSVQIRDSVDNPFIAASLDDLVVQGDRLVDIFALSHPDSGLYSGGDMVLRSANPVGGDAHYWSGGSFRIEELDNTLGNLESPNDPIIRAVGDVDLSGYLGTSLHILAGGSVNAGVIVVTGPDIGTEGTDFLQETIELSNGDTISIDGSAEATVDIRAGVRQDAIGLPGLSGLSLFDFFIDLNGQLT